jgi:general stress protein 26
MPEAKTFDEIAKTFDERVRRIVWCTVTTVDTKGRPFSRILHPIWEEPQAPASGPATGWIATGRQTLKTKHLARNPMVALSYWDPAHDTVIAQCRAEWCDDDATRRRIWELLAGTPPPVGYDPALFFPGGAADPGYGVLRLTPTRVELWAGQDMLQGRPPTVWKAPR